MTKQDQANKPLESELDSKALFNKLSLFPNITSENDLDSDKKDADDARNLSEEEKKLLQEKKEKAKQKQLQQVSANKLPEIGKEKAKVIFDNIFDSQIQGYYEAIKEIKNKIDAIKSEEINQERDNANRDNGFIKNIIQSRSEELIAKKEELLMLENLLKESEKKVNDLNIKKADQELKKQIIQILEQSAEIESYQEYDKNRKQQQAPQQTLLMTRNQAGSLSEIFGQNNIAHEVIEYPKEEVVVVNENSNQTNLPNQSLENSQENSQDADNKESFLVVVVHQPQINQQLTAQQGNQVSKAQTQTTSENQASNTQSKAVIGKYTQLIANQRNSGALVIQSGRAGASMSK